MLILDYKDRRPIYEQIVDKFQDMIFRGILEKDSQLPSVRSLASELSINPNTIQKAYTELERQGLICSVKGKGSFVADCELIKEMKGKKIFLELEQLVEAAIYTDITREEFHASVDEYYDKAKS